ncbi:MAG: phospholipase D-like domain-containing protein [Deltaproteobacteria bacterium]|nr:phospholipase D-like domain-containing protein [Deltaproteobacteria bacterium]
MRVEYIVQPGVQLGTIVSGLLGTQPPPKRVIFVSAFVGLLTVMRIKHQIAELCSRGSVIRFIIGIDMRGTSREVLQELLSWDIEVRIVKHRIPGHTFHPKIYHLEWDDHAEIIIGSNNITEGGFYRNYEGCIRIFYSFPEELSDYRAANNALGRFLDPSGPVVYPLTENFLNDLVEQQVIPSEAEARQNRDIQQLFSRRRERRGGEDTGPLFGTEEFEAPPPLPADLLEQMIGDVRRRRQRVRRARHRGAQRTRRAVEAPIPTDVEDVIAPVAFYMTLPTLQGATIPGEARIPLEAIELAREFWGWPNEYTRDISPRAGRDRVYWNWRPSWRVWSVENPTDTQTQPVRMYMYENSSDFRFYVRPLVRAGADLGDIVRIRRIAQPDAEYECILARQGTPVYNDWIRYCTQPVRNSSRRFGYA